MALSPVARAALARSSALNARYGLGTKAPPPRVKPTKRVVVRTTAPAVAPPLTLAQQAAQLADAAITPQRDDINKAIAAAEAQRIAHLQAAAGVTTALGQLSAGDAEAARQAFASAGNDTAAYAQGLTGSVHDAQAHASDDAAHLIAGLGAAGELHNGADANQNVSYMLGGEIPAAGLAAQAPFALGAAQARRQAGGIRVADEASMNDYKSGTDIQNIRDQLVQLEGKRPGLIQDALQNLTQQANAKRATDTQIGYLQLQQAKTKNDQAIAWTNITGTVHVVGRNGAIVDTGRPATGSDAAQVAASVTKTKIAAAASTANAKLSARTRTEVAATAAAATRAAAQTAATSKVDAAKIAADAKKAAAQIAAQKTAGKPATQAQRATVLKGATYDGNNYLKQRTANIWNLVPHDPQRQGESDKDFATRTAQATALYRSRLYQHRAAIVQGLTNLLAPRLRLLGYKPADVAAQAEAIVAAYIPRR